MQASRLKRLPFDPFALFQNGFIAPNIDASGCDVVDALVVAPVIIVVDECSDLSLEIARQKVVFQQNAVLQNLLPTLGLALRLRMIWRAARVLHTFIPQPFGQVSGHLTGSVVVEQARLVNHVNLITT